MDAFVAEISAALGGQEVLVLLPGFILLGSVLGIVVTLRPELGGRNIFFYILLMLPTLMFMGLLVLVSFYLSAAIWSLWFGRDASNSRGQTVTSLTAALGLACLIAVLWVLAEFLITPVFKYGHFEYGPVELVCLYVLFLAVVVALSPEPFPKIVAAMMFGLALTMVGLYPVTGELRMTFGTVELLRGIDNLAIMLGIFVVAEILLLAEGRLAPEKNSRTSYSLWGIPAVPAAAVVIGCVLLYGFLPARWPEEIRLLNRIESDGTLFAMLFGGVAAAAVAAILAALAAKYVLRLSFAVIAPVILVLAAIGMYTINNANLDFAWMLLFGVFGYLFVKLDYPRPVLFLAILIGAKLEQAAVQSALIMAPDFARIWTLIVVQLVVPAVALLVGWRLVRPFTARFSARFAG